MKQVQRLYPRLFLQAWVQEIRPGTPTRGQTRAGAESPHQFTPGSVVRVRTLSYLFSHAPRDTDMLFCVGGGLCFGAFSLLRARILKAKLR
jgi:hypothetical protein